MIRRCVVLVFICTLIFTLVLTGCMKQSSEVTTGSGEEQNKLESNTIPNPAKTRDTSNALIVAAAEGFTGNFLPCYSVSSSEISLMDLTYSTLLKSDDEGNFSCDIAKNYEISDDRKTVTFRLRDDVVFTDGTPLTAKDVAFSFNSLADPSYDGPLGYLVMDIEGYDEYVEDTEGEIESMSGVEIVDDNTIRFTFYEAFRPNFDVFSSVSILPEHFFGFKKGHAEELKSKAGEVLGSGPYKMIHYEPAQYVELVANENYYGDKKPQIKKIISKVVQPATMFDELGAGQIDLIERVSSPEKIETIKAAGFIDLIPFEDAGYQYFEFNCKEEPTNDKRVRQALVYGLDRKSFVGSYFKGMASTQDNIIYNASWAYTENVTNYDFNPTKAGELLDEAGWVLSDDGYRYKDGVKLSIELSTTSESEVFEFLTPIMIDNYKAIGVELLINYLDYNSLCSLVFDEKEGFNMYFMGVGYSSPDPDQMFADFHTQFDVAGGYNASRYNNETADMLLEKGKTEFNKELAKVFYEEWSKLVTDDMPRMILYTSFPRVAINSRVKGHKPSAFTLWSHDILNLYIED